MLVVGYKEVDDSGRSRTVPVLMRLCCWEMIGNKGVNRRISLLISDKDKCFEENKMRGGALHCIKVVQEDLKENVLAEFRQTGSIQLCKVL